MKNLPSPEERIWAVLAHISALAFGMGILLPIVGWSEQRRKSKYASFQCLQALGYQSLGYTFWLLSSLLIFIGILIVIIIMSYQAEREGRVFDPIADLGTGWISIFIVGLFILYMIPPIVASIACALGKDFHYPVMGSRLARYLGYETTDEEMPWLIEDREDRWVVAMGHFGAIILLWGLLAPAATWMLQAKRSVFLRFQSIQTVLFQAVVTILYFGGIAIYIIGLFALLAATGVLGSPGDGLPVGLFSFAIFMIFSLLAFGMLLLVPMFHILGQWAGYRVLKGDHYRYPLVGRVVDRWMVTKTQLTADRGLSMEGKTS